MTSKKKADSTKAKKGTPNMEVKSPSKKKSKSKTNNGSVKEEDSEVLIVPSSSPDDSQNEQVVEEEVEDDDEEEEEEDAKKSDITNQRSNKSKEDDERKKDSTNNKKKKNSKKDKNDKSESNGTRENSLYTFPMNRINRIIKSDDSNIRLTQEAIFLVNKASEKFLELFCKEAYVCSVLEHKKFVSYEHLSTVVTKRKRFDFLSDFVPERVKAEEALAEVTLADDDET